MHIKNKKKIKKIKTLECETLSYDSSQTKAAINKGSNLIMAILRSYKHPYLKPNIIQTYSSQKMLVHINA